MSSSREILVTGGAGFIGSHTVDRLLEQNYQVRVLDNLSSGSLEHLPVDHPALEFVEGDIRDAALLASAMQGVEACLHLAAQVSVSYSMREPKASAENNIIGFVNVLEAAREAGVRRMVYASSAAIYGDPKCLPVSEQDNPAPISPYGLEKYIDEQYAGLYQSLHGIRCLGLRYFNTYGPRQDPESEYAGVISIFAQRIREQIDPIVFGDGRQTRDFIYVGDVADANVAALNGGMTGVCNVASGEAITLLALIDTLAEITGNPVSPRFEPARSGDIHDSCACVMRMREELGASALTPLTEGLRVLIRESG